MSDTTTTNTDTQTEIAGTGIPCKMTIEDTVKMLQSYLTQADNSLNQLQNNIDQATNQINEWKRLQLMIIGQKQLIIDLINKTTGTIEAKASATK